VTNTAPAQAKDLLATAEQIRINRQVAEHAKDELRQEQNPQSDRA
jgi:hypothetical protein